MSHGRLTPLVGKTLVAGGLNVYFSGIRSSFAFILLTYKILIMLCIGVDGSFYLSSLKKGKRRELWLNAVSCKQLGSQSLKEFIIYEFFYYLRNFHIHNTGYVNKLISV